MNSTTGDQRSGQASSQLLASERLPILDDAEVAKRTLLLGELYAALAALGVRCVLARRHRLVLRYNDTPPLAESGPTDPASDAAAAAVFIACADVAADEVNESPRI
jgi:hypothetical protein